MTDKKRPQLKTPPLATVPVAAGTLIHIAGIPFRLAEDTMIDGNQASVAMLRATGQLPMPTGLLPEGERHD